MSEPTATTDPPVLDPPVLKTPNGVIWTRRETDLGPRYAPEHVDQCVLAVTETAHRLITVFRAIDPSGGAGREMSAAGRAALAVISEQATPEAAVLALETAGLLTLPETADDIRAAVREQAVAETAADAASLPKLTPAQHCALVGAARGETSCQTARRLGVVQATVCMHLSAIRQRWSVGTIAGAVALGFAHGVSGSANLVGGDE